MGSPLPLFLWINLVIYFCTATKMIVAQQIEAAHVFDHVLGRYAFESYNAHNKTGFLYEVQFPGNLSDIRADTVRFRCGSLKRYGAQIKEFSLAMGVTVQPCVERVLIVRQNLGEHWSPIYFDTTKVSATYQLVSHVLGLVAYDATNLNSTNLSEVELHAGKNPIKIDFSNVVKINSTSDITLLCASFDSNGKTSVSPQISPNICSATRHGHFALVIESFLSQTQENSTTKASRWKIIVGSTLGGALGVFLLGLLFHAMLVKVKKKSERVQMERRAYEEEALQISMVGHVRAPTASGTRTQPSLEHDYIPPI